MSMNRILICIAVFVMAAFSAMAQGDSLDKLVKALDEQSASFDYTFSTSGSLKLTGSGIVKVQGACFYLKGNGLEVWSDGESIWTLDTAAKELYIDSVDQSGTDISNPAQILGSAETAFTKQLATSDMVVLVPKGRSEVKQIKLVMKDKVNPILTKVSATTSDGTVTDFVIKNMKYGKTLPMEQFKLDEKTLSKDYIITDLR